MQQEAVLEGQCYNCSPFRSANHWLSRGHAIAQRLVDPMSSLTKSERASVVPSMLTLIKFGKLLPMLSMVPGLESGP